MKFVILAAVLASAYGSIVAPIAYTAPLAYTVPIATPYAAPISISSQYHAQDTLGQYNYGYANGLSSKAEIKSIDGITRGGYSYVDAEGKLQSVQYTSDSANGFRVAASNLPVAPAVPKVEPLPQPAPVKDTPEVAAAKSQHLAALEEAKVRAAAPAPVVSVVAGAPGPVASLISAAPIVPSIQSYAYGINAPVISAYSYPSLSYAAPWLPQSLYVNAASVAAAAPIAPLDTPAVAQARAEHLAAVEEVKARN